MRILTVLLLLALVCGCINTNDEQNPTTTAQPAEEPAAPTTTEQPAGASETSTTLLEPQLEAPTDSTNAAESPENVSCDLVVGQVNALLANATRCGADSDCTVTEEFYRCKDTRCYSFLNANADLAQIRESLGKYDSNCPAKKCSAQCPTPPPKAELKCLKGRCTGPKLQGNPTKT